MKTPVSSAGRLLLAAVIAWIALLTLLILLDPTASALFRNCDGQTCAGSRSAPVTYLRTQR